MAVIKVSPGLFESEILGYNGGIFIIVSNSASLHVSKLSFRVSKHFSVSKAQLVTVCHCLLFVISICCYSSDNCFLYHF